jgi:methyl-accepting chemotaxis protein
MQAKLGAGFLTVALLHLLVGLAVPRLGLDPTARTLLLASAYVVIGLGAAWIISTVLGRRLRVLASAAGVISKGDLTRPVQVTGRDETAELARSFSAMSDSLLNVVLEVQATSDRISSSAQALSATSDDMNATTEEIAEAARAIARGAEDQANQVLRITQTTRELVQAVEHVASRATEVHASAREAAERAAAGTEDARTAADGIEQLTRRTESARSAVEGFRRNATEIGTIVASITSISHQTHLLAINAAIEAARAGEQGRGFAVVAEEVGRLADNVRALAERISGLSEDILQGSLAAADEIASSVAAATTAREAVSSSARSFEGILGEIRGTASLAGEISELARRQRVAADDVRRSLEEISNIAERNASGTEEASLATHDQTLAMQKMAESARALADTSHDLKELVAIFRVR